MKYQKNTNRHTFGISLCIKMHQRLKKQALKENKSVSFIIYKALLNYFKSL